MEQPSLVNFPNRSHETTWNTLVTFETMKQCGAYELDYFW